MHNEEGEFRKPKIFLQLRRHIVNFWVLLENTAGKKLVVFSFLIISDVAGDDYLYMILIQNFIFDVNWWYTWQARRYLRQHLKLEPCHQRWWLDDFEFTINNINPKLIKHDVKNKIIILINLPWRIFFLMNRLLVSWQNFPGNSCVFIENVEFGVLNVAS